MKKPEPITNVESLAESPLSFSVLRSTTSHVGDRDSESRRSNIPPEEDALSCGQECLDCDWEQVAVPDTPEGGWPRGSDMDRI